MNEDNAAEKPTGDVNWSQRSTFFKYCSNDNRVIKGIFEDHKIRFAQPGILNDPLEFNPIIRFRQSEGRYKRYCFDGITFVSDYERIRHHLIQLQLNDFGILSLTKDPENFDMWSRYANGHQGFLLELKADFNKHACMWGKDGKVYPVQKVTYPRDYVFDVEDLVDEHGEIALRGFNARMFFKKNRRWCDEHEWRMVRPLEDHPKWRRAKEVHRDRRLYLFDFSLDCVQSITFGACMSPKNKQKIKEACSGTSVRSFLQAMIGKGKRDRRGRQGVVVRIPMDNITKLCELPDICIACDELPDEAHERPSPISRLCDLPYYAGNEKWVEQYYRRAKSARIDWSELS